MKRYVFRTVPLSTIMRFSL